MAARGAQYSRLPEVHCADPKEWKRAYPSSFCVTSESVLEGSNRKIVIAATVVCLSLSRTYSGSSEGVTLHSYRRVRRVLL